MTGATDHLRVLILDDQYVQREGIIRAVQDAQAMRVAAATGSPEEALEFLQQEPVDLALVDLILRGQRGTAVGRVMRRLKPDLPVIIYTREKSMVLAADIFWSNKGSQTPALQGYILTSSITGGYTLRHVYEQILATGYFIDPEVLEWHYRLAEFEALTWREEECALLLAEGFSNDAISGKMGISTHRVENIISTLYLKFRILGDPGNPGRRVLLAEAIRMLYGHRPSECRLTVLIIEDQEDQRHRLRHALSSDKRLNIVGEASGGYTGLELARQKKPDVVLVDIHLPDVDGLQATRLILEELPGTCVIIHSAEQSQVYQDEARRAGAIAMLSKGAVTSARVYSLCCPDISS